MRNFSYDLLIYLSLEEWAVGLYDYTVLTTIGDDGALLTERVELVNGNIYQAATAPQLETFTSIWLTAGGSNPALLISSKCFTPLETGHY